MTTGKVYIVGAGPGKPDLITVRGLRILREADVVVYDYLVDARLLEEAKQGSECICADNLRKKGKHGSPIRIEGLNRLVVEKAHTGRKVVRLKNGDPSLFSRGAQELEALVKNRVEFEIVPGVTAASAAAAFTGVPLTDRNTSSCVVLVTGHESPGTGGGLIDWERITACSTIALYMAVGHLAQTVDKLLVAGKPPSTPVVAVSRAGDLNQKVVRARLQDIAAKAKKAGISSPAIVIVGPTAKLERNYNWLKTNKRILFTGLSPERFFLPGTYFHLPLIKIEPIDNYDEFDGYLKAIGLFDWIVFTSRYGAEYFFRRLNWLGFDTRRVAGNKIAAIGDSTEKKLLEFGIIPDLVPREESSRGLIKKFQDVDLRGKRIFLPRSDISDKGLEKALEKQGAKVTGGIAYRNVMPENLPDLDLNYFNEILFTSPSTVRNFIKRYRSLPAAVKARCIGEVTRKEVKRWHLLN